MCTGLLCIRAASPVVSPFFESVALKKMGKLLISAINSSPAQEFQSTAQTQYVFGEGLAFGFFSAFCNISEERKAP